MKGSIFRHPSPLPVGVSSGYVMTVLGPLPINEMGVTLMHEHILLDASKIEKYLDLYADKAPNHVARLVELAKSGAYDGVVFHRVIDGFMAQTGDVEHANMENNYNPGRAGTGGSDLPDLPAEFSRLPHDRGTLGAARSMNPNSANSQFFICFDDARFLDGQYTVWGEVTEGMENVDALPKGEPPRNPGKIVSMKVAADA